VRQGDEDIHEHHVDLAAEQAGEPGPGALAGDVGDPDPGQGLEQFAGQVRRI
jgi:hypothetical protein